MMFGIFSLVLVLAMVAFNGATEDTREDAARAQADAAAQQVASLAVDAGLFIETHGATATFQRTLELDQDIEGHGYDIRIRAADGTKPDRVEVEVPAVSAADGSGSHVSTAILFSAGAPAAVQICNTDVDGGSLTVRFDADIACADPSTTDPVIYLEAIP